MRKPHESLDDFVVKAETELAEPPARVSLRLTGEVEVLKPLARWERSAKLVKAIDDVSLRPLPRRLSWFHRSLAAGGGLGLAALVLASAIVIGVSDSPVGPDVAGLELVEVPIGEASKSDSTQAEEPLASDIFTASDSPPSLQTLTPGKRRHNAIRAFRASAAVPIRTRTRKVVSHTENGPDQSLVSKFAPTTLVIYIENGLIKSRIEPWLINGK